jgi:M6 family metalloprotease-like protein
MSVGRLAVILVVALSLALVTAAGPPLPSPSSPSLGKAFSAVPLHPDAVKALKARGKSLPNPFPNSANRGRKFNPTGDLIPALATSATQQVLVLFVDFSTPPPGGPAARLDLKTYFDAMLFESVYDPPEYQELKTNYGLDYPTDRTLKNYYEEVSYGSVHVVTLNMPSTLGWSTAPRPYDDYCKADGIHDYGFGPHPYDASGLVLDVVKAADAVVDFSQYAVGGTVPNLFVVHAGTGAEWNADPSLIWSHSWSLAEAMRTDNGYMTDDGVWVSNYAIMPEVGGDLTNYIGRGKTGPFPPTVGVYAHEYGHVLGLPDQYDYGYESLGTWNFSLMAGGSWNTYPYYDIFSGNSPAHLDAWSKYRLGFLTPVVVTDATDVTLAPVETTPAVYKMVVPKSGGKEYFLFENRQRLGFDEGLVYYGAGPNGTGLYAVHGLAIYHVDDGVFTRNYWFPNEAENWKEFRSEGWRKAWTGETHYGISLIQADDGWHLERFTNYGDPGDLYPGTYGVGSFGNASAPNSSAYYFWSGNAPKFGFSGVTATNITEAAGNVSARLSFVPWR